MAARVTAEEVKQVIETDLTDLSGQIASANVMVTALLGSSSLDSAHLKEIERWLAAHFVALKSLQEDTVKLGPIEVKNFTGNKDLGLNQTQWGQQVLFLDTTGAFASLGGKQASFKVY